MMKEIGSEFYWDKDYEDGNEIKKQWILYGSDYVFTFSGRTAIETVIEDIGDIEKVYFPSYCCQSMLEPFEKRGINIEYYSVEMNNGLQLILNIPPDCDVLFLCNYFGFNTKYSQAEIKKFKARGGVVIEDITHSLLSVKQHNADSDYLIASLRKWGALLSGGFCSKKTGEFRCKPKGIPDKEFLENKFNAMRLKAEYLKGLQKDKNEFLAMYMQSNRWVENNYSGLYIDDYSAKILNNWDIDRMRKTRINNAKVLYNGLDSVSGIQMIFPEKHLDCPLFVPIVTCKQKRGILREKLIEYKMYFPIHWPKPNDKTSSELYDREISLVCDQRYNEEDMLRIVEVIKLLIRS